MLVSYSSYRQLTQEPGVYLFLDNKEGVIYCGKAKNLRKRVSSYFLNKDLGQKTRSLVGEIKKIRTITVNSEVEAFLLEEKLVKKYRPKFNIALKDDKSFPMVKITIDQTYPAILVVRKKDNKESLYFGPYTSANSLRLVLKLLRKIFPYQSVMHHPNTLCLYNHLGLCPCPGVTNAKDYKMTIKYIINFLKGNTKKVVKDLEKSRNKFSKNEEYEDAMLVQKQIDSIKLITSPFYKPFEYEENPNFKDDVLSKELDELANVLKLNGVAIEKLKRIECYDISNTAGKNATASLVVLTNGIADKSQYRRFKIRRNYNTLPNDLAMMSEVISRRLNHPEWPRPDLIVVDGGKGQVSAAFQVLENNNQQIPLVGLAKREETIVTPSLKEIHLPKSSKALQLIMKIRDEAHRFAITYHKKLRSKSIFE